MLGRLLTEPFLRFGLNSLLWWLVVALAFVLLLAASLFGFFLHLSEFLLPFLAFDFESVMRLRPPLSFVRTRQPELASIVFSDPPLGSGAD